MYDKDLLWRSSSLYRLFWESKVCGFTRLCHSILKDVTWKTLIKQRQEESYSLRVLEMMTFVMKLSY